MVWLCKVMSLEKVCGSMGLLECSLRMETRNINSKKEIHSGIELYMR